MKIAGVSMTYNDGYKLKEWKEHYQTYKDQLDIFVIVDNGSDKQYLDDLKNAFKDAILIERQTNCGCTAAYNDGIQYVLNNSDAEAISIIGNDIKLSSNCIPELYKYLFSDETLGMVSSAILYKDSNIIDNYGHQIRLFRVMNESKGEPITSVEIMNKHTDLLTGGFNMAKRGFYLKAGLQDENLFMYADELDTMYKGKKAGYKFGVIANEYAWHWHISPPGRGARHPQAGYMVSRNRMYIVKKYRNLVNVALCFIYTGLLCPLVFLKHYISKKDSYYLQYAKYSFIGAVKGITGDMKPNKYSFPITEDQ